MKSRVLARAAGFVLTAVIAFAVYGCSKKAGVHMLIPNQRPSVDITSAPVDTRDTAFYAYRINWSGDDPDGRIDHYALAIDPGDNDTTWQTTTKNEQTFFFRSTDPVPVGHVGDAIHSINSHTFVIKAFDNLGLPSAPKVRSFFSYTVAPTVLITSPLPSPLLQRQLTPSMRVSWTGSDPDGQFTQKPVKYKYKLFSLGNSEFDYNIIRTKPDSLRRFYAKTNFATWDSVGGDTTTVQFTGLTPGQQYIFVVIGYDEAGAYSPSFSLSGNMLQFEVGFAGTLGPIITAFNQAFFYRMISGGFTPNDPTTWVHLELPAPRQVTFNWSAEPPPGANMQWYRWRLDGDVFDETARTNEATDWYHWSAKSVGTVSCTIGPFQPNVQHFLYIEAMDNNGLLSLLTIVLHPVLPTFDKGLLVVDDTRLEVEQLNAAGKIMPYTQVWPSAAELDTFFYARGGVPWRGTQVAASVVPQPVTKPGIFAGYDYDTLGTRLGLQIAATGVPLSLLGKYKHIIWLVDRNGGANTGTPIDAVKPTSTLHWLCTPNHMNTLGSYMTSGGSVWLTGGDGAFATLREFNAKGADNNDGAYGPGRNIFSNGKNELVPGRVMYDAAHWQSELCVQTVSISAQSIVKSPNTPRQAWTSPGWNYTHPLTSPDYNQLPALMRTKQLARGDSLPPTRPVADQSKFYNTTGTFDVEYMTQPNYIIEDMDPNPFAVTEASALDTLMDARGGSLAQTGNEAVTMTWYHGVGTPDFVFSGFSPWLWTRSDDQQIVDFVLQQIWKVPFNAAARSMPQSAARPVIHSPASIRPAAAPVGALPTLPTLRTAGR
jgi:hypothetical protein